MWQRDVSIVAALDEPVRSDLYRIVSRARNPVNREEAATEAGISRKLAAFHLEKLVEVGLLAVATEAKTRGSRPRQVGRAPKLYVLADGDFSVSIPPRRYDLLGDLLLDVIEQPANVDGGRSSASVAAVNRGMNEGLAIREEKRVGRVGPERALTLATEFLQAQGYEPDRLASDRVVLRNCPFKALAVRSPELVCEINRSYLEGLLRGLGSEQVRSLLMPTPGHCCVELSAAPEQTVA